MHTPFLSGENAVKMSFVEKEVTALQAELAELREHVHKLVLVGESVAFHKIKESHSLRMLGGHAA